MVSGGEEVAQEHIVRTTHSPLYFVLLFVPL